MGRTLKIVLYPDDGMLVFKNAEIIKQSQILIVRSNGQDVGEFAKDSIKRWYFEDDPET